MKNKLLLIVLGFTLISFCLNAHAEELTATLSGIVGEVKVLRAGETTAIPAENGMIVNVGDTIETGGESFVAVTFIPKTFIEIASDSQLRIAKHELDDATSILRTKVDLLSGHLSKAILNNLPPDALFEIVLAEFLPVEAEAYQTPEELLGASATTWPSRDLEAELKASQATISNVTGTVEILRVGEVQTILGENGMVLNVGDTLMTGRDSYATLTFLPRTFIEASGNSEVKIIRHGPDEETGTLSTRVDVLSGHLSKAIVKDLPPDANFEVVLVDYIPLEAEPAPPETITAYNLPSAHGD